MKNKILEFTDLTTWQESHKLVLLIYRYTKNFPKEEIYSLMSQLRRASISVTSNIAEGFGRYSYNEKKRFYYLALGSLVEVQNEILIAKNLAYLKATEYKEIESQVITGIKLLKGLINKTKKILNSPVSSL
jgi:four helix bundle protein